LKNADNLKANPYFWSTYVVIGDSSPLFKKNLSYLYWLGAILLLAAGGFLLYIRKQRIIKGRETFKPDTLLS
jgi:LPXTG-motif cell wall-anchored protein